MQAIHIVMHQNCFPNIYSHQPRSMAEVTKNEHKKPHVGKLTAYLCACNCKKKTTCKNTTHFTDHYYFHFFFFSFGGEGGPIQFMFTLFQKINLTQRNTKASFGVPPQADNYRDSEHPMCTGAEARESWQLSAPIGLFVLSSSKNSATCSGSVAL